MVQSVAWLSELFLIALTMVTRLSDRHGLAVRDAHHRYEGSKFDASTADIENFANRHRNSAGDNEHECSHMKYVS